MRIIGLTGQSGAGKTSVSNLFRERGIDVIDADVVSRQVVEKGSECLDKLVSLFSDAILLEDKSLNRRALSQIVFSDGGKRKLLEDTIYPYINDEIAKIIGGLAEEGKTIVILDAPTLFESGTDKSCDRIISVVSNEENRLGRIMRRDALTKEQALLRIHAQKDEAFFRANSDYVIENNGGLAELSVAAWQVLDRLKEI